MFYRLFFPKTFFYDWKLYGAQFLSSRQFPESSIKTILLVSTLGAKSNCTAVSCRTESCWRKNFILVFLCCSFPLRNAKKVPDERKSLQDYTFLITCWRSRGNRIIAISPVKTKNRVKSIESRDVWKQKKIYRLLLYRGFASKDERMDMKSFCIQFHVCYVFCCAALSFRKISREIKFIFLIFLLHLFLSAIFYSFIECSFFPLQIELCSKW